MKTTKRIFALIVLFCISAFAIDTHPAYIPNTATVVTSHDALIYRLTLSNVTAGAVTVTISDRSANCNSAACQIWSAVSIAANTVYTVEFGGIFMESGFTWTASAANSVIGRVTYAN